MCFGVHPGDDGRRRRRALSCRAFTLLEALMACGILLGIVVAVTSAMTAGQQNAFEAHQRIAASLAAEELMGRIICENYANLPGWHGFNEPVGTLTDMKGHPLPESQNTVGRVATVTSGVLTMGDLGVNIQGRTVKVRAFNRDNRTLAELSRFIPEPGA